MELDPNREQKLRDHLFCFSWRSSERWPPFNFSRNSTIFCWFSSSALCSMSNMRFEFLFKLRKRCKIFNKFWFKFYEIFKFCSGIRKGHAMRIHCSWMDASRDVQIQSAVCRLKETRAVLKLCALVAIIYFAGIA